MTAPLQPCQSTGANEGALPLLFPTNTSNVVENQFLCKILYQPQIKMPILFSYKYLAKLLVTHQHEYVNIRFQKFASQFNQLVHQSLVTKIKLPLFHLN